VVGGPTSLVVHWLAAGVAVEATTESVNTHPDETSRRPSPA
jgi:hypothetical protein